MSSGYGFCTGDSERRVAANDDLSMHLCLGRDSLPARCRKAYRQYNEGLLRHQKEIPIDLSILDEEYAIQIHSAVVHDDPRVFYVGTHIKYHVGNRFVMYPEYRFTEHESKQRYGTMLGIASELKARSTDDPVENEFLVNDYLQRHVTYHNDGDSNFQHMDSALLERHSVCNGISMAASFLLNYMGVPTGVAIGTLCGGNHAWNIVNVNGERYHLDVTNNHLSGDRVSYRYFNADDSFMRKTHDWTPNYHCSDPSRVFVGLR